MYMTSVCVLYKNHNQMYEKLRPFNMKVFIAVAISLITITVTKCATKAENKMKEDVTSTTPNSMEEQVDRSNNKLMPIMMECNDTFRVETSYLETLNRSGSFPDETDRTPKCFIRCVLEKCEVLSTDSHFDVSRTAEVFPQIRDIPHDDIIKMATTCSDRSETCQCERSYQYFKCLLEMAIDNYDTK